MFDQFSNCTAIFLGIFSAAVPFLHRVGRAICLRAPGDKDQQTYDGKVSYAV